MTIKVKSGGRRRIDCPVSDRRSRAQAGGQRDPRSCRHGIELLTEDEYRQLQQLGEFDTKTSSWVKNTVADPRAQGRVIL
jgi:hypothetical protein